MKWALCIWVCITKVTDFSYHSFVLSMQAYSLQPLPKHLQHLLVILNLRKNFKTNTALIICSQDTSLRSCSRLSTVLWVFCHIKMERLSCYIAFPLPILSTTMLAFVINTQTAFSILTRINSTSNNSFKIRSHLQNSSLTQDSHKGMRSLFPILMKPFLAKLVHLSGKP